jgi:hypothetical protein
VNDLHRITIVSGGQTGADRAALDFAIENGLPHEGWCPKGRLAEDGRIDAAYNLTETPSRRYALRTEWNIRDSDATVVFSIMPRPAGGTRLTLKLARLFEKPLLHLARHETDAATAADRLREFIWAHEVRRLNLAGPRASQEPDVGLFVRDVLRAALLNPCP